MKKSSFLLTCLAALVFVGCYEVGEEDFDNVENEDVSDEVVEKMNGYLIETINQVYIYCGAMSIVNRERLPRDLIIDCFYQTDFMYCEKEDEADRNKKIHIPDECLSPLK